MQPDGKSVRSQYSGKDFLSLEFQRRPRPPRNSRPKPSKSLITTQIATPTNKIESNGIFEISLFPRESLSGPFCAAFVLFLTGFPCGLYSVEYRFSLDKLRPHRYQSENRPPPFWANPRADLSFFGRIFCASLHRPLSGGPSPSLLILQGPGQ